MADISAHYTSNVWKIKFGWGQYNVYNQTIHFKSTSPGTVAEHYHIKLKKGKHMEQNK